MEIHTKDVSVSAIEDELRTNPARLEEKKEASFFSFEEEEEEEDWEECDRDENENTPLMAASFHGNVAVVQCLLLLGANIDARNYVSWKRNLSPRLIQSYSMVMYSLTFCAAFFYF